MKIWKALTIFFGGIITGLLIFLKLKEPSIVADTYVESQDQEIGKIKQKGRGNAQKVKADQRMSKRGIREQRKDERKLKRAKRKNKEDEIVLSGSDKKNDIEVPISLNIK